MYIYNVTIKPFTKYIAVEHTFNVKFTYTKH